MDVIYIFNAIAIFAHFYNLQLNIAILYLQVDHNCD